MGWGPTGETEVEIWRRPKKINFLTLVSYSLLQTVFSYDVPFCHNTKRHRQTDKQTDRRQTDDTLYQRHDSTVGQKMNTRLKHQARAYVAYVKLLDIRAL